MSYVLVLYYSRGGSVKEMAELIARGVERVSGIEALVRTVPSVSPNNEATEPEVPEQGAPYVTIDELKNCSGLVLGSPGYFANMSSPMRYFWETTTSVWFSGDLVGKPAGVFTSTGSYHGGQETTLTTMMWPLMHHGMVIVGIPFTNQALLQTKSGGTPYGASHVAGDDDKNPMTDNEKDICIALGERVAGMALRLK